MTATSDGSSVERFGFKLYSGSDYTFNFSILYCFNKFISDGVNWALKQGKLFLPWEKETG